MRRTNGTQLPGVEPADRLLKILRWVKRQGDEATSDRLHQLLGRNYTRRAIAAIDEGYLERTGSPRNYLYKLTDLGRRVACGEAVPAPAGATGLREGATT